MDLEEPILKILSKRYDPSSFIETRFERYDLAFKTNREGTPMVAFLGKKDEQGHIQGERFARRLRQQTNGIIVKCCWEKKGEIT
jgi:hypothetical protein